MTNSSQRTDRCPSWRLGGLPRPLVCGLPEGHDGKHYSHPEERDLSPWWEPEPLSELHMGGFTMWAKQTPAHALGQTPRVSDSEAGPRGALLAAFGVRSLAEQTA